MKIKIKTKSLKNLPIRNDLTRLSAENATNLVKRCRNRLEKKQHLLKTNEISFLLQFNDQITNKHKYLFTNKQISWLIKILDKSQTQSPT